MNRKQLEERMRPSMQAAFAPQPVVRSANRQEQDWDACQVPVEKLDPDPEQPRKIFPEAEDAALAENIREVGQLQALLIRPRPGTDRFWIVCGEKRCRALKLAGKTHALCRVLKEDLSPEQILLLQLAENLKRDDLRPSEKAHAFRRLADEDGSMRAVGRRLGIDAGTVSRTLSLLKLPADLLALVDSQTMSLAQGLDLAGQPNEAEMRTRWDRIQGKPRRVLRGATHTGEDTPTLPLRGATPQTVHRWERGNLKIAVTTSEVVGEAEIGRVLWELGEMLCQGKRAA